MTDALPAGEAVAQIPEECLAVVRHLWDLLDHQLTEAQADRLRGHIGDCEICHRYHLYQENFLEAMAAYRSQFGAPLRVKEKVLDSLHETGFAGTG
jgi:anti-sigma factor (TIGR02949 family)